MTNETSKSPRVLSIVPFYRAFGYAVLDGDALVDWGTNTVPVDDNIKALAKVEFFMVHYRPDVLSMEDFSRSRRGPRIRTLIRDVIDLAPRQNIGVKLFSRGEVYQAFFGEANGSKEALAALLAKRFPDELEPKLPPKRRAWEKEDTRLAIFDAVALALVAGKS
jgi:hypothetical protein